MLMHESLRKELRQMCAVYSTAAVLKEIATMADEYAHREGEVDGHPPFAAAWQAITESIERCETQVRRLLQHTDE